MKYYATITSRSRQFEIGGTKESLIQDLKRMKRSGELDGSEIICIYGVDLRTDNRIAVSADDENHIMNAAII